MSWQNAPVLTKLTSAQNGGNLGAQLWGVDYKGKLYTIWQKTPGGEWTNWMTNDWAPGNHPKQVYELAAVQLGDGRIKLWILDLKREIWTTEQESAGGNWMNWWHSTRSKWNNAPDSFKKLAAVHRARAEAPRESGSMFIGVKENGWLAACFEARGTWGRFRNDWSGATGVIECTACQQKDARMAVWVLNDNRQLFFSSEETKGTGDFSAWAGPNWLNAPKLRNIAAVEGSNGAIIVGQDEDYRVVTNFQSAPGSNQWSGWSAPNWANAPRSYELTACVQNNGLARIWAVTLRQKLTSIAQTEPNRWPDKWSDTDDDPYPPPPAKK
jgi:hypothetical protein